MTDFDGIGLRLAATVTAAYATDNKVAPQPIKRPTIVGLNEVRLTVQQMQGLQLTANSAYDPTKAVGGGTAVVPMTDPKTYIDLPIPKAALFGKQNFSLALADPGRVSTLGYGRSVGAPGALNALGSIAGEPAAEESVEAVALKAAADKIAQQARLSSCIQGPATVPDSAQNSQGGKERDGRYAVDALDIGAGA